MEKSDLREGYVAVPREAVRLAGPGGERAVLRLYTEANDRWYEPWAVSSRELQAAWSLGAKKTEALLEIFSDAGFVEILDPGDRLRPRRIRVRAYNDWRAWVEKRQAADPLAAARAELEAERKALEAERAALAARLQALAAVTDEPGVSFSASAHGEHAGEHPREHAGEHRPEPEIGPGSTDMASSEEGQGTPEGTQEGTREGTLHARADQDPRSKIQDPRSNPDPLSPPTPLPRSDGEEGGTPDPQKRSLDVFKGSGVFTVPQIQALREAGIETVGDLIARSPAELQQFKGFAAKTINGLRQRLQAWWGLDLAPTIEEPPPVTREDRAERAVSDAWAGVYREVLGQDYLWDLGARGRGTDRQARRDLSHLPRPIACSAEQARLFGHPAESAPETYDTADLEQAMRRFLQHAMRGGRRDGGPRSLDLMAFARDHRSWMHRKALRVDVTGAADVGETLPAAPGSFGGTYTDAEQEELAAMSSYHRGIFEKLTPDKQKAELSRRVAMRRPADRRTM